MWKKQNRHERGYGYQWEKARQIALSRDNYLCQHCLKKNRATPAQEVDHIVPKAKGGTDDIDNLQSLCPPCHRAKTIEDNGGTKIKSGSLIDGSPDDPDDPWHEGAGRG
jgi:5-methylcytosine-specific restriction endonuclease McrA